MALLKFETVIDDVLKHEGPPGPGGLNSNEPDHVGGVSYRGITQKTWEWYLSVKNLDKSPTTVRAISEMLSPDAERDTVYAFYTWFLGEYGKTLRLPYYLWYAHVNWFTINPKQAIIGVQLLVGVDADGGWGSGTQKAVDVYFASIEANDDVYADNAVLEQHHQYFSDYLLNSNGAKTGNLQGYKNRLVKIYAKGLELVTEDDTPIEKEHDLIEDEEVRAVEATGKLEAGRPDKKVVVKEMIESLENIASDLSKLL